MAIATSINDIIKLGQAYGEGEASEEEGLALVLPLRTPGDLQRATGEGAREGHRAVVVTERRSER
jgi:hypothetical protein